MYKTSIEQLKNIPLFAFVEDEDLELIEEKLEQVTFPAETLIIKEGDPGDCLYLLKSGRVKVFARNEETDQEIILSYLESGDHFGEMALISGDPRSASILSVTDVDLWKLDKEIFDTLLMNNPKITVTLTHLLTQRLKEANISRKKSEKEYESKFKPHGDLNDINVIQLIKYAEDNALTGKITFEKEKDTAVFIYKKGQLVKLEFADYDEDEGMDILLGWKKGSYRIEPHVFKPLQSDENDSENKDEGTSVLTTVEKYLHEKFLEFIHFAGSRITQRALNRCYHNFEQYFDIISEIKIQILPEFEIELKTSDNWTDKHTLLLAIIIRDVVSAIDNQVIGMIFWTPRSEDDTINSLLENLQFFEYYEQSTDVIKH
jgi:CRP-like cAMP-binding protein